MKKPEPEPETETDGGTVPPRRLERRGERPRVRSGAGVVALIAGTLLALGGLAWIALDVLHGMGGRTTDALPPGADADAGQPAPAP